MPADRLRADPSPLSSPPPPLNQKRQFYIRIRVSRMPFGAWWVETLTNLHGGLGRSPTYSGKCIRLTAFCYLLFPVRVQLRVR